MGNERIEQDTARLTGPWMMCARAVGPTSWLRRETGGGSQCCSRLGAAISGVQGRHAVTMRRNEVFPLPRISSVISSPGHAAGPAVPGRDDNAGGSPGARSRRKIVKERAVPERVGAEKAKGLLASAWRKSAWAGGPRKRRTWEVADRQAGTAGSSPEA